MPYPDVKEIRERLEILRAPVPCDAEAGYFCGSQNRFVHEALWVCDQAERNNGLFLDIQVIAQLQFIERVLNG